MYGKMYGNGIKMNENNGRYQQLKKYPICYKRRYINTYSD